MDQPDDGIHELLRDESVAAEALVSSLLDRCVFPCAGTAVVCAVSGGSDSLALMALAVAAGLEVTAVHVDHGTRPGSVREADVVRAAAAEVGAGFRAERVEVPDGGDYEARARAARFAVLGDDVLTGHTADDQAETVLLNLLRGTGLGGLAAMRPGGRHPILGLRRADTEAVCEALDWTSVADPTNHDPRFVRNRVRHELLPLMNDISDRDVVPLIVRTSDIAHDATAELDRAAASIDPTDVRELANASSVLAAIRLRQWLTTSDGYGPSAAEVERVMAVVRGESVACQLSRGRTVRRTGGVLRIEI